MSQENAASGVKSVHVALDILDVIAAAPDEIGVTEIAQQLGLTKASVFRHLKTLTERGLLNQNGRTARYGLGMRLHVLGKAASRRSDLLSVADPIMHQLRDDTSMTVNLAGFLSKTTVILQSLLGPSAMEISVRVGTEFPYHATSQGMIALAFGRRIPTGVIHRRKLEKFTEHTIVDPDEIERQIELARERGWAMALQQTLLGIYAVSVPVFDSSGDCIAAVTLVGSMQFLLIEPEPAHLAALAHAGARISSQLGFMGRYPRAMDETANRKGIRNDRLMDAT